MKFSYNFLQSFFEKKIPSAKELADLLMMHFFEVEEVKKVNGDYILDIDVLSSRAGDCLSHVGIAREISAITGIKYNEPKAKIKKDGEDISERLNLEVRSACSRYTLCGIEGVKVKNSPSFIQKRLTSCGIKPINNIVDIVNYVMLETGQPLHAFDAGKIEGEKIIVRYAKKREKIVTLDEKRYELIDNILVIADELSPIAIAGIKGGIVPEVDKDTNTIYLEAANFDPVTIRKASQFLKIRTDASLRFEHGIPLELTEIAIKRAVSLITENAGGKVLKGMIDYYPQKSEEKEVVFKIEDVRRILGIEISFKEVERILRALEFKVRRNQDIFYVEIPYFRTDVAIKEDVIEEVGRMYGYEKITPQIPREIIKPNEEKDLFSMEMVCKNLWKGFGFTETYNYSFINESNAVFFERKKLIEMEKPVSLEFKYLRPSLLAGLLKNLAENERNYENIKIFEIGKVFYKEESETEEKKKLAIISSNDDFYGMKGKINLFLKEFLLEDVSYTENQENHLFCENRSAKIMYNGEEIGLFGELSEKARKDTKIKSNAVMAEIDFEKILKLCKDIKIYDPILKFPSSVRDVAVLVPQKTTYEEVLRKIENTGGKMLKNVFLFDSYEGKEIPEGTKSLAFRLTFQAKNRTLSSEEVNDLQKKIINILDGISKWKVRKQ